MATIPTKAAYRILDVYEGASPDEIKNGYRIMVALKWHPDRHHNIHDKEFATRQFAEVTDAYRTLVREGKVKPRKSPMISIRPEPPPMRRPPPIITKHSSDSSVSLDSFVHLVASSTESHTTPPSSSRESPRSWKQGVRQPFETMAAHQYRSIPPPLNTFEYESQRRGAQGPAVYKAPQYTPNSPAHQPLNVPQSPTATSAKSEDHRHSHNVGLRQQSIPPLNPTIPVASPHNSYHQAHFRTEANNMVMPPYGLPLASRGLGHSGEWVYSLTLTLEELFTGKHCRFGIPRVYISGKSKNVVMEIDIPAGCRPGTRILCRNVGHEWNPGHFQDIAFIIEEAPHDRFVRLFDDLIMDVRLPWVDSLRRQGGKVPFVGIDGRNLAIQIDYPREKTMKGRNIVKGAGMPIREGGQVVGRGNMVVQWEILPPQTKILHFMKRLWGFRK
ncbi:hypothetical protein B0H34DRAFT_801784 [Crassisporium funariophilum]|nr:hypothetical protein B0H34DRAFT_801784 [Crassisporium funariophilum]